MGEPPRGIRVFAGCREFIATAAAPTNGVGGLVVPLFVVGRVPVYPGPPAIKSPFPSAKAETEMPKLMGLVLENVVGYVSVYCRAIELFKGCN